MDRRGRWCEGQLRTRKGEVREMRRGGERERGVSGDEMTEGRATAKVTTRERKKGSGGRLMTRMR